MTERKVLNKYFPPDYDPSKIPRLKRGSKSRQFNIRTMAPFNMRCLTCNGYVYKAKKFNSRMEVAEGVDYLGLRHYRFYIRCPTCCAEIIWRTDLESNDYVLESGAKRNFEALKTAEEWEAKKAAMEEEELANNPMKLLEKRTNQSKHEMETAEALDDLRELNKRQATMETDAMLLRNLWTEMEKETEAAEMADEDLIKELLSSRNKPVVSRVLASDEKPPSDEVLVENAGPSTKTVKLPLAIATKRKGSIYADQIRNAIVKKCPKSLDPKDTQKSPAPLDQKSSNVLGLTYSSNSDSD